MARGRPHPSRVSTSSTSPHSRRRLSLRPHTRTTQQTQESRSDLGAGLRHRYLVFDAGEDDGAPVGATVPGVDSVLRPSAQRPDGEIETERRPWPHLEGEFHRPCGHQVLRSLSGPCQPKPFGPLLDRLLTMTRGLRRLDEAPVERGENLLVAANNAAVLEDERRDAPLAGRALEVGAIPEWAPSAARGAGDDCDGARACRRLNIVLDVLHVCSGLTGSAQ